MSTQTTDEMLAAIEEILTKPGRPAPETETTTTTAQATEGRNVI